MLIASSHFYLLVFKQNIIWDASEDGKTSNFLLLSFLFKLQMTDNRPALLAIQPFYSLLRPLTALLRFCTIKTHLYKILTFKTTSWVRCVGSYHQQSSWDFLAILYTQYARTSIVDWSHNSDFISSRVTWSRFRHVIWHPLRSNAIL